MPSTNKNDHFTYFMVILGVVGLFSLILATAYWPSITKIASRPMCDRVCHFMQPELKSWQKSSHSHLSCYSCHIEDFYFGLSRKKMATGFSRVWLTIRNSYPRPLNADNAYSKHKIPSSRCLKCHNPQTRRLSPRIGLTMSKNAIIKHLNAGLSCTICHNRIAHKGAENYEPLKSKWKEAKGFKYKNFLTMKQGCWRCHSDSKKYRDEETLKLIKNGKTAPKACTTCHYKDFIKSNVGRCENNCHSSEFINDLLIKYKSI